ncbi:MAG TPA: protein-S-isoprenylcysteine methyltransferase [Allosphingosinicella sp.]
MNAETRIETLTRRDPRPASAVSTGVGFAGLAGLAAWAAIARVYGMEGPMASLVTLLACGVPMVLWSLLVDKVHRNPSTGIDWDGPPRPIAEAMDFTMVKLSGLWAMWGVIGSLYCIARWYWDGAYLFAMEAMAYAALPMLVLSVPYVLWLDRRLVEPRDGAWHFGQLIIGRRERVDREILYDFFRAWAVKGFFLAFMISIVPGNWADTIRPAFADILADPVNLARWLIGVMFMIDVSFATVGYMLTMKPLDAHIRSANPYASGWVAALICYPPFILMGGGGPLDYHPGTADWSHWLDGRPLALAAIGFILVALTFIYAWATVAFGLRFSNLTHRGILTHGPYAWSKHPAYLSKNLFWWFASMPFLATTGNPVDMIRNTVMLAIVAGVYYWRARTEEQHLLADPAYQEYAAWMDRHGPIPRLVKRLRGKPPAAAPVPAE